MKPTRNGICHYFYLSLDDSEHFKDNRHVLIVSINEFQNSLHDLCPSFRHLTSSISISKDSEGNSKKNADVMIKELGLEAAAYYGVALMTMREMHKKKSLQPLQNQSLFESFRKSSYSGSYICKWI